MPDSQTFLRSAVVIASPPSQFVDVRGLRIHLRELGSGPPLLWLHGAGGAGPWRPWLDALAERFRVIVPDHPGFGASDEAEWLEGFDDLVYHYLDLLATLGLSRVQVVGHSLGGWIAAELAVAHPEVVERLVLVDPIGLRHLERPVTDLFALTEAQSTRLVYHDPALADAELANESTAEMIMQRIKNQTTFARLSWNPYLYNPHLRRRLYRITMPTLLVWGRHDRVLPLETAELWTTGIPQARLAVVEECGHAPQREQPQELVRLVTEFLGG